jgi:CheY-like chemotaxis protein
MNQESSKTAFNWHGKRILIVEDDYVNYLFYHEILSCAYACLIRAVSLQEAFDMLSSDIRFDLIMINSSIPGNENCRSVKRIKLLWPHLRVIAISDFNCRDHGRICPPTCCDTIIGYNNDSNDIRIVVNEMFYPVN